MLFFFDYFILWNCIQIIIAIYSSFLPLLLQSSWLQLTDLISLKEKTILENVFKKKPWGSWKKFFWKNHRHRSEEDAYFSLLERVLTENDMKDYCYPLVTSWKINNRKQNLKMDCRLACMFSYISNRPKQYFYYFWNG